ncbi:MAG: hypothetical protein JST59_00060 [Actinobacteria bacterium]|nr:hypothetical protein [Actinomycetota bacterium]
MHTYKRDEEYERKRLAKKKSLSIASVLKKFDKRLMVREFLFEEPTSGEYVIPEGAGTRNVD